MSLLQMSFAGGIMVLVILAIRAVSMNRLPKATFLILWLAAVIRLLVPFSVDSEFSIYSFIDRNESISEIWNNSILQKIMPLEQESFEKAYRGDTSGEIVFLEEGNWEELAEESGDGQNVQENAFYNLISSLVRISVWKIIWFTGMVSVILYFMISYIVCMKKFKTSIPVVNDFTKKWLKDHSCKRKIQIRHSDVISSPLTYGILRPVILVPKHMDWSNETQLQYIFLHEYIHICRFDLIWKLVLAAVVSVHWFNPLVWVLYFYCNRDIELSCDEIVVRKCGKDSRSGYARSLINMKERHNISPILSSHFSKNIMEERVVAIMKTKKNTITSCVAAGVIILCVSTVFLTSGCSSEESHSQETASETTGNEVRIVLEGKVSNLKEKLLGKEEPEQVLEEDLTKEEQVRLLEAETLAKEEMKVLEEEILAKEEQEQALKEENIASEEPARLSEQYTATGTDTNTQTTLIVDTKQEEAVQIEEVNEETAKLQTQTEETAKPELEEQTQLNIELQAPLLWPTVSTRLTSQYGERIHPGTGEKVVMDYIGIGGEEGDAVYAAASGTIIDVGFDTVKGKYITLRIDNANNIVTAYGHLKETNVETGNTVTAGDVIGTLGKTGQATGNFLSFSVYVDGKPVDPMTYFE